MLYSAPVVLQSYTNYEAEDCLPFFFPTALLSKLEVSLLGDRCVPKALLVTSHYHPLALVWNPVVLVKD